MSYAGKTIGSYEVIDLIGAGGMGEVYRATDTKLGREVAVKFLPASVAKDANRLARFEQEARSAGALNHPNIVTIFELGTHDGAPYIVMELVDGKSLRKILGDTANTSSPAGGSVATADGSSSSASGPGAGSGPGSGSGPQGGEADRSSITTPPSGTITIPMRKAIEYAAQMARGLAAAHDRNIVHRDLKPDNVLIARDGRAKILDFGLAKLTASGDAGEDSATMAIRGAETTPGAIMGTVGYMSPEQVRGEEVDHRADLFALGVILYEMLSGRRAFHADTTVQTMNAILTEDPPPLTSISGSASSAVPHSLDGIVRRCLEKNPAERFQSGHDLAYALEAAVDSSVSTPGDLPRPDLDPGSAGRRSGIPMVAALALAAFTAAAGWFLGTRGGDGAAQDDAGDAADWSQARFVPLTFEDGVALMPALAPDGNSFVYLGPGEDGSGLDIYFRRVGGEVSINLTDTPAIHERDPAFSPDGSQIAFAVAGSGDADGIYVMGATGESRRKIIDQGGSPAWSPDGTQLAVATHSIANPGGRPATSEVRIVDISNGQLVRRIHDGDAVQPDWSPDGRWIAFWGLPAGTGSRTLYTVPAEGGEATALNDDAHINWCPRWSADSRHLYFASDRGGTMDIWRVPIDPATGRGAGRPEAITSSPIRFAPFDLATTANRIVGTATTEKTELIRARLDKANGRIVDPETIFGTSRSIWSAEISPDGEWLIMMGNDPSEDLFVCKRDGSDFRRLTNDAFKDRGPTWAGDSKTIYFFSDRDGKYRIWRMERDGSGLEQITNLSGDYTCGVPSISADGRYMTAYRVGLDGSCWFEMTGELPYTEANEFPPIPGGGQFFAHAFSPGPNRVSGVRTGEVENAGEVVIFDMETRSYEALGTPGPAIWLGDHELGIQSGDSMAIFDVLTGRRTPVSLRALDASLSSGSYCGATGEFYLRTSAVEANIWLVEAVEPEPFAPPSAQ